MSGGHFGYEQYKIGQIADAIENVIANNDSTELNKWGERIGYGFCPEVIAEFRCAVIALRRAEVYAQRIDWLVSGDDGEDSFLRRLAEELREIDSERERGLG